MKLGNLRHEHHVTAKMLRFELLNAQEIRIYKFKRSNVSEKYYSQFKRKFVPKMGGLVKLPKDIASPYPFLSFSDRIEPQKALHPKIEAIFKSVYRHWDGMQWVKPTRNYSSLKKLKEIYIRKGYEWPELCMRDLSLNDPIIINPSPKLRHAVHNDDNYRNYIRKVVKLQKEIARTSRRLRNAFKKIPSSFVCPSLRRLGYSHKYLKYAKEIPQIHQKIMNIITMKKYGNVQIIEKLSSRMNALMERRFRIWKLREIREQLFDALINLNSRRN
ncbi:hypothetical protein MXB_5296, partial [Myxobolus squamalis]